MKEGTGVGKEEVKKEVVKREEEGGEVKVEDEVEGEGEVKEEEDEGDSDEVPYVEEIGWREVLGFIVMYVLTFFGIERSFRLRLWFGEGVERLMRI